MALIDTHCHLNHPPLSNDTAGVLARATAAGVTRVIVPAYDAPCWDVLAALATRPGVSMALGLHPWLAHDLAGQVASLEEAPPATADLDLFISYLAARAAAARPVAIGEIGLDTKIGSSGLAQQLPLLECQLALAADLDLPVILHCRGAFEEMLTALTRHGGRLRGVMHAYSRGPELAARFVAAGMHIAFGGAVTRERAAQVRRAVQTVPLDRLLLETDAPSIGLDGILAEQTEPRHVLDVATAVTALRGETLELVAAATSANAVALFGLGHRAG